MTASPIVPPRPGLDFPGPHAADFKTMQQVRDHVAKGALSMISWANYKPENRTEKPKVGGHQASSMSSVDLLCALYLNALRPGDRLAVKPHAAPILYALMHLMGQVTTEQMGRLREYKGLQPYPTKLKNPDFVDYTTSSEALGVAAAIYDAYGAVHQNRALKQTIGAPPVEATYWAHCGDGELTEGQIDESLYDAGRWQLSNLIWIVDLNRQSLDRVMDDSGQLGTWVRAKFEGQAWDVLEARWGAKARALFDRPGGDALRTVLERLPDSLSHPLLMLKGGTIRAALTATMPQAGSQNAALAEFVDGFANVAHITETESAGIGKALLGVSDVALAEAIAHLGGHDMQVLCDVYDQARQAQRPVMIMAHTVKGYETTGAAHPENHGGLLPVEEVAAWGLDRGLPPEVAYPRPDPGSIAADLVTGRARELFPASSRGHVPGPVSAKARAAALGGVPFRSRTVASTGEAFQSLNMALLKTELGPYLQFGAPDVGQTTHLGPIIKSTGVFAPRPLPDTYRFLRLDRKVAFDWRPEATGQFHAFGIAEGNAMLWAYAFGRQKKAIEGKVPLLPVVTVYDKFYERAFNQLDYAVYSDARFIAVGTPSGTGLSRETATHQSIQTMRMMMDLPGLMTYEPAFAADVHAIYLHALGQLWDTHGEPVYLRLSTQPLAQPAQLPDDHAAAAVRGAYWLIGEDERRSRGATGQADERVIFVASGRKLREVREAAATLLAVNGVGSRILNVTSFEALWRDWDAYRTDPTSWDDPERSYILHDLFAETDLNAPMVIVSDNVPSVAEWFPGALQRLRSAPILGPRHNGEAGAMEAIDALHRMGVEDILAAARAEIAWRRRARWPQHPSGKR
ncbi:MAG: pyruvate dehydrogenase E1 component [Myxococcota bacterium]|jgi:pyruvate dehydrogenase E1 component